MEKIIKQSLDHPNSKGLQDPFQINASLHASTTPKANDTRASTHNRSRDCKFIGKEGYRTDVQRNGLPQSDICCPQERRRLETSPRSQQSESICLHCPFQDGIVGQPEGSDQPRRLSCEDRPQGCLSDGSNAQGVSALPQIQVEEQHVSVCHPPLRISPSSVCIHETSQACRSPLQKERGENHDLHRQSPHHSIQPSSSNEVSFRSSGISPESWLHNQLGKIDPIPTSNSGVSGNDNRHHLNGTETSPGQDGESPEGMFQHSQENHHSQDFTEADWENDIHNSSSSWKLHSIIEPFKPMPTNFANKEPVWTSTLPSLIHAEKI